MIRQIIKIDEDKCTGCGLCVSACHEGAIGLVDGKAKLLRDDYCDGLGNCLPACPTGAITFEEREAPAYDEAAVKAAQAARGNSAPQGFSCPGSRSQTIERKPVEASLAPDAVESTQSELRQWPVQIQLAPINAPYFQDANLLVSADCAAYARANFHSEFIRGKVTLIGCPKLDPVDYSEKLTEILKAAGVGAGIAG